MVESRRRGEQRGERKGEWCENDSSKLGRKHGKGVRKERKQFIEHMRASHRK